MADDEDKAPLELTACVVDLSRGRFSRDGATRSLTALELGVLRHLRGRPGEVVSRDELLQAVWGYDQAVLTRSVDNTVSRLRTKVEADPKAPDHLQTIRGRGYVLDLPTRASPAAQIRSMTRWKPNME